MPKRKWVIGVTEKQKLFCDEYLIDLNATQAAIRAGYSEKTAYSIGNENLNKPELCEYIQKRLKEKEDALIAKQDEVLKKLTRILRREELDSVVTVCKSHKSYYDENGNKVTFSSEEPIVVEIPAKISDVNRAAELLGKRYGMFTEKIMADAKVNVSEKLSDIINQLGADGDENV